MKILAFNIDDDDPNTNNQIIPDGGRIRVPMMMRDSIPNPNLSPLQRAVAQNSQGGQARFVDAAGRPAGNRPGFIFSTDTNLADARATREAEYQRREDYMTNAWRGRDEAASIATATAIRTEGAACVVRNDFDPNDPGRPGTWQRVSGALTCVVNNQSDAMPTMDARQAALQDYDQFITQAWRGPNR